MRDKGTGALYRLWLTLNTGDAINIKAVLVTLTTLLLAVLLRYFVRRYRWPQLDMLAVLVIIGMGAYLAGWTKAAMARRRSASPARYRLTYLPSMFRK